MLRKQVNPMINVIASGKAANQFTFKESATLVFKTSELAIFLGKTENCKVFSKNQNNKGE
ncbi:hypothetical protein BECAL_01385 [Bellilinea caldifistulae]|uniref:hypothetical protein n=1 Tax=Bellilinea caldifistulae TaxID=360411 RepID=UPI0011AE9B0E|nr:hypothetical protein [Bellilinea caldifistulae]GAP10222.1 hypothetical protein BECAL_01385 [Bellilinea caldifistulae]